MNPKSLERGLPGYIVVVGLRVRVYRSIIGGGWTGLRQPDNVDTQATNEQAMMD